MTACHTCGNDFQDSFRITTAEGRDFDFDSFECAIQQLAPQCTHCGCRIIGHGVQAKGQYFCCAHCARKQGPSDLVDNADTDAE